MSIYALLNSDRSLLALPADQRLAAVRAKAWTAKTGDATWVWNMNLISRLGSAQAVPLIATINALADGQAPLPESAPAGSIILLAEARNAMRSSPGVNVADRETLPMLQLLAANIPSLATALNTIIGYGWNYSTELGEATLEQVAAAAAQVQMADDAKALIDWARNWSEQVRTDVQAALTAGTLPSKATLKDGLVS